MKNPSPLDPNILLVDDNRDGLLVRRTLLEEAGCRVQIAHNGEEGLKYFKSNAFDVIITDYRMPGMNGVELIATIRTSHPNACVILLSGFVDPLGLTEENTGADVVIPKSSKEATHLLRWVKRLVNRAPRKPPAQEGEKPAVRASMR